MKTYQEIEKLRAENNRLKEKLEIACFNCEQAESQGRKINEMYGQCLMENNLLKDRIAELEAEKSISDKALELAIFELPNGLTGRYTTQTSTQIDRLKCKAKQELAKEKANVKN